MAVEKNIEGQGKSFLLLSVHNETNKNNRLNLF